MQINFCLYYYLFLHHCPLIKNTSIHTLHIQTFLLYFFANISSYINYSQAINTSCAMYRTKLSERTSPWCCCCCCFDYLHIIGQREADVNCCTKCIKRAFFQFTLWMKIEFQLILEFIENSWYDHWSTRSCQVWSLLYCCCLLFWMKNRTSDVKS